MAKNESVRDWFIGLLVSFGHDDEETQRVINHGKWSQEQDKTVDEVFERKRQLKSTKGSC